MKWYQIDQLNETKDWIEEDDNLAAYEGWCISETSKGNIVICKLDLAERFQSDQEAVLFVMSQYLKGSGLAAKAIKYILNGDYEIV